MIFIGHKKEEKERIIFLKKIIKNVNTLDMGAADGLLTRYLINPEKVTALDYYADELSNNPAKTKIIGDIKKTSFRENKFDQILLLEVIEHQREEMDRVEVLKEAYRILKKGGTLILSTPNKKRLTYYLRLICGKKIEFPHLMGEDPERIFGNYHYLEYTEEELKKLCKQSGFSNIQIKNYYLQIPYLQLFFKIKCKLSPTLFVQCKK